uniref:non-specific serine/threonine protein kinase n=1 Tax=Solibacter usitatus (strain Ellin6076) TaxID=234267 RepID=Q021S6_SOLUE
MPLSAGARFGPYEIRAPLGAGGMGEVYRARDTRLGRDVALKILPPELAEDPSRRARFEQEARAVAALNHPNIVAVFDVGDGYMVSELVEGEPLRASHPGLRKTLDLAGQIASGLAAAHAAGIVHRDLKPENVLVTKDGRAKILDFGLARIRRNAAVASGQTETATVKTEPGTVMGTVGYMSPEQVRGLEADHRSDIFSFGVMLHEMLAGTRPFLGETSVETMMAILKQDAPDLPGSVPETVRTIVEHCLEKEPANRFQSAKDLGFALAQSTSRSDSAPVLAARPGNRRRAALAAALMVLSAAATWWLSHGTPATQWTAVELGGPEIALSPRLSPDGHVLAMLAMVDGNTQVAVMKPETGSWNVLTHSRDQGMVTHLSWSQDGASIYYSRLTDVPQGVFSVPFLGGEEHLVLENAANPAVLQDGTVVLSRLNGQNHPQLFRFWPETGKLQELPVQPDDMRDHQVSRDGRHAVVTGAIYGKAGKSSLIEVDLLRATARVIPTPELDWLTFAGMALSPDGRSVLMSARSNTLSRVIRVPLDGGARPQDLFRVTSTIWGLDAAADGSVLANLVDRPTELVSFPATGGPAVKIAGFRETPEWDMVVALPDGRAVTPVEVAGLTRLIAVAPGKTPSPLIQTPEATTSPVTAVGADRIAFLIGPEPHDTIAIANTSNGRIGMRIAPGKGMIESLAASPDGGTLYFGAGGSIWSVASSGGEGRRICPGSWVVTAPWGGLIVARTEIAQIRLFELPAGGGPERAIPVNRTSPLLSLFITPGTIRADRRMLVSLNVADSWFNPLALLDLDSGKVTRIAGDGVSDLHSGAWSRDGRILASRKGMQGTIWRFTPEVR